MSPTTTLARGFKRPISPRAPVSRSPVYVLLGANGDLCAMLPAFLRLSQKEWGPVNVVVSKKYAPLLEGVSYVNPITFNGDYKDCVKAASENRSGPVTIVQSYGNPAQRTQDNFVKEMWSNIHMKGEWDVHPLVFDNRSPEREKALLESVNPKSEPMILVGTKGTSAPFEMAGDLVDRIRKRFPEHRVVDLGEIQAERIYDMLGLYDAAQAMATIDTVHLHLSRASKVPVVALSNDTVSPFCGGPEYSNQIGHFWYSDYPTIAEDLLERLELAVANHTGQDTRMARFYHVHSEYPRKDGALRRNSVARETWATVHRNGRWAEIKAVDEVFSRTSKTAVGDTRVLPFVKDVIDFCASKIPDERDYVVLTNDDTCFVPELQGMIDCAVLSDRPAFAHRWDFFRSIVAPIRSGEMLKAKWYPGSDLFVFSKRWWLRNRDDFPDLILACEYWDCVLRQMIKRSGGLELPSAIYHEWHDSAWQQPGFREENPGQKHNIAHAKAWFGEHWSDEEDTKRQTWFNPSILATKPKPRHSSGECAPAESTPLPRFYHGGHCGDVIAALPVIRQLGGGSLIIGNHFAGPPMAGALFAALKPLLEAQPYIKGVEFEHSSIRASRSFAGFRELYRPTQSLSESQAKWMGIEGNLDLSPWLTVTPSVETAGKIVVARSGRWQSKGFPWRDLVRANGKRMIFVGLKSEYQAFCRQVASRAVTFRPTDNLLQVAELIAGSDLFIGNQSAPCWIAMGLGHPLIQESFDKVPDSIIERPNARFCFAGRLEQPPGLDFWL